MMCFYLALCMEKLGAGLRQVGCQWVFLKRSTRIQTARDSEDDEASPNHILEIVLRLPGTTRNLMEIQGKFRENSTEKSMEYQNIWISSRISPYFQDSPPMIHMDSPEIRLRVPCKVPSSPINRLHQNTSKKHTQNPRGQFSACHLWRRPSITTMKWWILLSRNWPLLSLRH